MQSVVKNATMLNIKGDAAVEENAFYVALSLLVNLDASLYQIVVLSLQVSLLAVLIAATLGFPLGVGLLFWKYGDIILRDQTLRAYGLGGNRKVNPHFIFRKAYSQLYKHFKPDSAWWIQMQMP